MENSLISIILPTYNVEKYIAKALQSCVNQSFKNIEIIVVDDCGNDKSILIAKEYAKKDNRIKIIHNKENLQLLRARYEGVNVANAPYIMFLDPDDYLELDACEKAYDFITRYKDIDILFFNAIIHNDDAICYRKFHFNSGFYHRDEFIQNIILKKNLYWTIWAKLIKKDLYLQAYTTLNIEKDVKLNMAEDVLLYYPMLNKAEKIGYLNEDLYHYMINNNSICNIKDKLVIEKNIKDQYLVLDYLKQNYIFNKHCGILYVLIKYLLFIEIYKMKEKNVRSFFTKLNILAFKILFKYKKIFFLRKHRKYFF